MNFKTLLQHNSQVAFLNPVELKAHFVTYPQDIECLDKMLVGLEDYFPVLKNIVDVQLKGETIKVIITTYYPVDNAMRLMEEFDETIGNALYKQTAYRVFTYLEYDTI